MISEAFCVVGILNTIIKLPVHMMRSISMLFFICVFVLTTLSTAQAQSRRSEPDKAAQKVEKKDDFLSIFKKKEDKETAPSATKKDEHKSRFRILKGQHKEAKAEVRASRKERKAAEAREEAARARAAVTRAKKRAAKAEKRADKADEKAKKARTPDSGRGKGG